MNRVITTVAAIPPRAINSGVLFCVCIFCLLYMYFLSMTVIHVVVRKEVSHEMNTLRSAISTLETEYIMAQHEVSKRIAEESDLTATENKIFVSRAAPSLVLREPEAR